MEALLPSPGGLLVKLQRANLRAQEGLLGKHRMANLRALVRARVLVRNQGVLAAGVPLRSLALGVLAGEEAALAAVDLAHNLVLGVGAEEAAPAVVELVAAHLLALHARAVPSLVVVAQEEALPPMVDSPLVDSPLVETVETPVTALEAVHLMVAARAASPLVATGASRQLNWETDRSKALQVVGGLPMKPERAKSRAQLECEGSNGVISIQ